MTVSDLERGKAARPATVLKLAKALNIQPSEFLEELTGGPDGAI